MEQIQKFHKEHILVCLSSSPSNAKIIETAAKMTEAFKGTLTALFVQTPEYDKMSETDQNRLQYNMRLAEQLHATITTVYGTDIAYQIAEFARISNVTKIVLGRSHVPKRHLFRKQTLTEKLSVLAPDLDVYIIPDIQREKNYHKRKQMIFEYQMPSVLDWIKSLLIMAAATMIGMLFAGFGFTEANIITVYILAVLLTALFVKSYICSLLNSILSVLIFNFLFTAPKWTFHVYDPGYLATFAIMLIASLITGSLANNLKRHLKQAAQSAFRTQVLFDTNQLLQKAKDDHEMIGIVEDQLTKLLNRSVLVYQNEQGEIEIKNPGKELDFFESSVVGSILGECTLAMENSRNVREKEEAAVLAKNEQLRANLLRTISHDLRTPLTSISGNAGTLIASYDKLDEEIRMQMFLDIYDDSLWLNNLVENLLSITRLEEGRMHFNMTTELVDDIVMEALRHVDRKKTEHKILVEMKDEWMLARVDARLIMQVIINLVNNAIKYTQPGSVIRVIAEKKNREIQVSVEDNGPGIADEMKIRIFEMFYTGEKNIADGQRSLGLGLALCRSIVNAHGGEIIIKDNMPQGALFIFTLPMEEVEVHE